MCLGDYDIMNCCYRERPKSSVTRTQGDTPGCATVAVVNILLKDGVSKLGEYQTGNISAGRRK